MTLCSSTLNQTLLSKRQPCNIDMLPRCAAVGARLGARFMFDLTFGRLIYHHWDVDSPFGKTTKTLQGRGTSLAVAWPEQHGKSGWLASARTSGFGVYSAPYSNPVQTKTSPPGANGSSHSIAPSKVKVQESHIELF